MHQMIILDLSSILFGFGGSMEKVILRRIKQRNILRAIIVFLGIASLTFNIPSCSLFKKYDHRITPLHQADVLLKDVNGNCYSDVAPGTTGFFKFTDNPMNQYSEPLGYTFFL